MSKAYLQPRAMKLASVAQGTFSGYGAVFGNEDRTGDIIEPGAFTQTLQDARARQKASGAKILYPILWMHDAEQPIGGITLAKEDSHGLYIEGQLDLDTDGGRKAFSGLDKGYASQFSIGYVTVRSSKDLHGIRHLQQINLHEISCVTSGFAANDRASVLAGSVKSAADPAWDKLAKDMEDWRRRRPGFVPTGAPARAPAGPAWPDINQAKNGEQFQDMVAKWQLERYLAINPPEDPTAKLDRELAAQRDRRVEQAQALGRTPPLADLQAYYQRHGSTPDGRRVHVDEDAYLRGYQARITGTTPEED